MTIVPMQPGMATLAFYSTTGGKAIGVLIITLILVSMYFGQYGLSFIIGILALIIPEVMLN